MSYTYTTDLGAIRAVVHRYAIQAGLAEPRAIDLVLAVSEVAANTVRHAKSPGSLKIWYDDKEIVCQINDEGLITDPLAGRRQPSMDARGGHGLWIVNQVCDEVEIHSDENGTTIRLHMALRPHAPLALSRYRPADTGHGPRERRGSTVRPAGRAPRQHGPAGGASAAAWI